jgi:hypothetical protein
MPLENIIESQTGTERWHYACLLSKIIKPENIYDGLEALDEREVRSHCHLSLAALTNATCFLWTDSSRSI